MQRRVNQRLPGIRSLKYEHNDRFQTG